MLERRKRETLVEYLHANIDPDMLVVAKQAIRNIGTTPKDQATRIALRGILHAEAALIALESHQLKPVQVQALLVAGEIINRSTVSSTTGEKSESVKACDREIQRVLRLKITS